MVTGPAAVSFTALADFFSEETRSQYVKGLSYTAIAGHAVADHVMRWVGEGKVELGAAVAVIAGAGETAEAEGERQVIAAGDVGVLEGAELDQVVGVEHQAAGPVVTRDAGTADKQD